MTGVVPGALRSTIRGAGASAFGTLAMDVVLYRRYRRDGGDVAFAGWETSDGLTSWEAAPAPALVARKLLEGGLRREVPTRFARVLNNATHWAFGMAAGAGYGLLAGSGRPPKVWLGVPFGAAVWAEGYIVLPLLGVYEPIWRYDLRTLAKDLSAHIVFGTATAAAFHVLSRAPERR